MSRRTVDRWARLRDAEVSRRAALKALAGGGLALGGAKAADNVLIGYGVLTGTNLVDQDLAPLAADGFSPRHGFRTTVDGYDVVTTAGDVRGLRVARDGAVVVERPLADLDGATGPEHDLPEALAGLLPDVGAIARGAATFEVYRTDAFFERVGDAEARPLATDAVRHWPGAEPDVVREFADADPADPEALLDGLTAGFRERSFYDVPRYAAGSIQDNVIFGAADLRAPFREPVDFESIVDGPQTGLFCYEFTNRSVEALHAVSAVEQAVPVVGGSVIDDRHKHVYTVLASLVREDGELRVPTTFVDYTHTTLYDDLRLRGLMGEGFEAYNTRHRATEILWNPYR
jgi:hypothetical protein